MILNGEKNHNKEYTVFRAYNKYWIADSRSIDKHSVNLSSLTCICSVDKISINEVLRKVKLKVSDQIKYEPFINVKMM